MFGIFVHNLTGDSARQRRREAAVFGPQEARALL